MQKSRAKETGRRALFEGVNGSRIALEGND
ncbi:protein of unknown function (plasmid) [Azospirillum baldaniorum]|uniref:Uncharacterized protein n=1 Tax=Azospirillum baldaniorum TaxID=1064539 RepID=A0A9P1K0Z3_9PROT|nr:protein of unknown function [Azospirillum baldaniorum]